MYNQIKLGLKIKELRKKRNLSQRNLSEKVDVPQSTISSFENGTGNMNIGQLGLIASVFNLTIDELLVDELEIYSNNLQDNKSYYFSKIAELICTLDEKQLATVDDFIDNFLEYKLLHKT